MVQKAIVSERTTRYYLLRRYIRMKLALCDDDKRLMEELKPFVYQYANTHRLEMAVDTYVSGEALLASRTVYDMIFLDYQMSGIDGLAAAKILRRHISP